MRTALHTSLLLALLFPAGCVDDDGEDDTAEETDTDTDTDSDTDTDTDADTDADTDTDTDSDTDTAPFTDPPTSTHSYTASTDTLLNPERGFYRTLSLRTDRDYSWVRDSGYTLAYSYVLLDDYRDADLDQTVLDQVTAGLAEARSAGIKIILRFAYNLGPYPNSEPDASKAQVLAHIGQLQPLLRDNEDVIAFVQAGFIGAWGEWHSSTNGLLDNDQDKFDILQALVDAVPTSRFVQLRYPPYKEEGYGGPLTSTEAFSGSYAARVGHHNDCFLASDTDFGTYPSNRIEELKDFVAAETLYLPMGGETCAVNAPRSECASALAEMERLHFTYINQEYHPDVVASWSTGACRDELDRRLGYRLVLDTADYPDSAPPGSVLPLSLALDNTGYAPPMNPRPVDVVLVGPQTVWASLEVDWRTWTPGNHTVDARFSLPVGLTEGSYDLVLSMPDAASSLANDARYAVQLANDGVWDGTANVLGQVQIDASAAGSVGGFTAFERIE